METAKELLKKIRALPENIRKLLAGLSLFIFALIIFVSWQSYTSSKLAGISASVQDNQINPADISVVQVNDNNPAPEDKPVLSPLDGLVQSLRDLKDFIIKSPLRPSKN